MEDGDITNTEVLQLIKEDKSKMANYPDVAAAKSKSASEGTKVNGASESKDEEDDEDSSDEDALVIDEELKSQKKAERRKRVRSPTSGTDFKGFKKRMLRKSTEVLKIVNDYINAAQLDEKTSEEICDKTADTISQGELDNIVLKEAITKNHEIVIDEGKNSTLNNEIITQKPQESTQIPLKPRNLILSKTSKATKSKKNHNPKLTEYAQYLGLQPTVKFKCIKCSESSFPSMTALKQHQEQCLAQPTTKAPQPPATDTPQVPSTNFRVTRKVYLCSACGTYYENWNLFLHMREVHRRFICLYCLGMFSLVEKLSQHLVSKHNCIPNSYLSAEEYLSTCKEPCFLMCCHCEKVFTEQDNFYDHVCAERTTTASEKACWSCGCRGTHPHLPSCKAIIEPQTANQQKPTKPSKTTNPKLNKSTKKSTPFTNVKHVTADSPSHPMEPEQTCDIANLCTVDMDQIKSEPISPDKSPPEPSPSANQPDTAPTEPATQSEDSNDKTPDEDTHDRLPSDRDEANDCDDTHADNTNDTPEPEQWDDNSDDNATNDEMLDDENSQLEKHDYVDVETNDKQTNETDIKTDQQLIDQEMQVQTDDIDSIDVSTDKNDQQPMESLDEKPQENTEVRRVPKVTLKLPPPGTTFSDNESDDSEKLTMEVDEESEQDDELDQELQSEMQDNFKENSEERHVNGFNDNDDDKPPSPDKFDEYDDNPFPVAGDDVPIIELELEQPLDKFTTENLIKLCLGATIQTCIYCNHARKIVVNAKQLGLHAIAEHRFSATVNSITAEELIPQSFVARIKEGLNDLEEEYFNLEKKTEEDKDPNDINFKRVYECFQCRYATTIHKDLYLHNRKMHAKTILLCIICKSNFYTYSELICHLCPGNYVLNNEMKFRCCMCEIGDLPSAFRLMVHLRKKHHTCDVCLEGCINQSKLSNHVWKHKLHHLCYRCGIAYRNKPDITKHLFWKHGTESVLCKKCLQKKWPHVYHFCIPPVAFVCEECNLSFSRAVYLKVHKRLHSNERKHSCTEENCTESFISKKLLLKHEKRHREPEPLPEPDTETINGDIKLENEPQKPESLDKEISNENVENKEDLTEKEEAKPKNIIDVYDLPALNLSESDSDDSDEEEKTINKPDSQETLDKNIIETSTECEEINKDPVIVDEEPMETQEDDQKQVQIVDGIWDNFKQYQATIEKRESLTQENKETDENKENIDNKIIISDETQDDKPCDNIEVNKEVTVVEKPNVDLLKNVEDEPKPDLNVIMVDHDYCFAPQKPEEKKDESLKMEHDYCTVGNIGTNPQATEMQSDSDKKKGKIAKKKTTSSSDSSSDSDSSSCTCGSNCSCSSSSGSSSSSSSSSDSDSSSSEGKRRIAARRERRKERAKRKKDNENADNSAVDVVATEENVLPPIIELPIEESDLDTDETETDEDFYDEHPQRIANKLLEEKRNQLMLLAGVTPPISNGTIVECSRPSTPSIPEEKPPKKKVKSKKRKKKSRSSTPKQDVSNIFHNHQQSSSLSTLVTPVTIPIQRPTAPSPVLPVVAPPIIRHVETPKPPPATTGSGSETDSNVRSSKRRRVPNKFYGYSSDDESAEKPPAPPILKWRKADLPSTPHVSPKIPPITIKNIPSPAPIIEPTHQTPIVHHTEIPDSDSEEEVQVKKSSTDTSDDNRNEDSDSDAGQLHISQPHFPTIPQIQRTNENLYCYCQCPYDEVSEMIACDGRECAIEWFHFECVGIMVPPKGKWYCPDCRKKSAHLRNDFIHS